MNPVSARDARITMGSDQVNSSFRFDRDTFTFANELVWEYHPDPATGTMTISHNATPPAYTHRCFVMVRSARQFFYHARFKPDLPPAEAKVYRRLIRQVVSRSPRRRSEESERIIIPGYEGLRAFCAAQEPLLKGGCGGPWQSYFVRSHWRMVFPIWPRHQERVAQRLQQGVRDGSVPTVHLFRFPRITINHGIVLYGSVESDQKIEFEAYDPNIPARPVKLSYERDARRFFFPPACYWAGGEVSVIEIFCGGLY